MFVFVFSGFFQTENKRLSAGHERLAIVRPETGQQPLFNADKTLVLIANGEIYNYKELAQQIGVVEKELATDCDVILRVFEKLCDRKDIAKLASILDGDFAFCIYDLKVFVFVFVSG